MQISKWLSYPLLIDAEEMSTLLNDLSPFEIYLTSMPTLPRESQIDHTQFLSCYHDYIAALKNGILLDENAYRHYFSSIFTTSKEILNVVPIDAERQLIRPFRPVIQLQPHRINYSLADCKFRSMSFGPNTISWGIQFSYPQLFKDNQTQEIMTVNESDFFPNTALFHRLQRWVRQHTVPTPFLVNGKKTNVPMRLGKKCFTWINLHPQLIAQGIQVCK